MHKSFKEKLKLECQSLVKRGYFLLIKKDLNQKSMNKCRMFLVMCFLNQMLESKEERKQILE